MSTITATGKEVVLRVGYDLLGRRVAVGRGAPAVCSRHSLLVGAGQAGWSFAHGWTQLDGMGRGGSSGRFARVLFQAGVRNFALNRHG